MPMVGAIAASSCSSSTVSSLCSPHFSLRSRFPLFSAHSSPNLCSTVVPFALNFPSHTHIGPRLSNAPPPPHRIRAFSTRQLKAAVVTKDSWDELILNSEIPVLVEFYASWCGPCRMVHRIIDEIAEEFAGNIRCFLLDTDNDLDVAEEYEIKAVPVVLLFKNGQKCESVVGTMPKDFYVAAIKRVLDS